MKNNVIVKKTVIQDGTFVTSGSTIGSATVNVENCDNMVKITIDEYYFSPESLRELTGFLNELADILEQE